MRMTRICSHAKAGDFTTLQEKKLRDLHNFIALKAKQGLFKASKDKELHHWNDSEQLIYVQSHWCHGDLMHRTSSDEAEWGKGARRIIWHEVLQRQVLLWSGANVFILDKPQPANHIAVDPIQKPHGGSAGSVPWRHAPGSMPLQVTIRGGACQELLSIGCFTRIRVPPTLGWGSWIRVSADSLDEKYLRAERSWSDHIHCLEYEHGISFGLDVHCKSTKLISWAGSTMTSLLCHGKVLDETDKENVGCVAKKQISKGKVPATSNGRSPLVSKNSNLPTTKGELQVLASSELSI